MNAIAAAHRAVARAIEAGILSPPGACEICHGPWRAVYHHHSYAPEDVLAVRALCTSCHRSVHTGRIPEPGTGRIYAYTCPIKGKPASPKLRAALAANVARQRADRYGVADLDIRPGGKPLPAWLRAARATGAAS